MLRQLKLVSLLIACAPCAGFLSGFHGHASRGTFVSSLPSAEDVKTTEFMKSFDLAAQVCEGLQGPNADAAAELVPSFMTTSDAARGWFVTSLTTPEYRDAALHPSVVEAVVTQPKDQVTFPKYYPRWQLRELPT